MALRLFRLVMLGQLAAFSFRELFLRELRSFDSRNIPTTNHSRHRPNGEHQPSMGIFVLTETSAGLALFKAKDKQIFKNGEFSADVTTASGINEMSVQLPFIPGLPNL